MSRFLTTGLNKNNVTSGDSGDINDAISYNTAGRRAVIKFLIEQSNLKVLMIRTQQILKGLNLKNNRQTYTTENLNLGREIAQTTTGNGRGPAIDLRFMDVSSNTEIDRILSLTNDRININFTNNANRLLNHKTKQLEERILKMIVILKDQISQFINDYKDARDNKFSQSQSLNLAFDKTMGIFKSRVESMNLVKPSIISKVLLTSAFKNKKISEEIYESLTFNFE